MPPFSLDGLARAIDKKPNKKAEQLLLSVLNKAQRRDYKKYQHFEYYEREKDRVWEFYFRYHYPIEVITKEETFQLCVDFAESIPTEDLLLMAYLEVKGGRGDKLFLLRSGINFNYPAWRAFCIDVRAASFSMREVAEAMRQMARSATGFDEAISQLAPLANEGTCTAPNKEDAPLTFEQLEASVRKLQYDRAPLQRVTCNLEGHNALMHELIELSSPRACPPPFAHVGSIFGIEVYVDPNQKEPFKLVR